MNKGKSKSEKAITLIALVITIVVLIILAGVTISLNLGENGIFNKAKQARENYMIATNEEKSLLANIDIDSLTDGNTGSSREDTDKIAQLEKKIKELEQEYDKYKEGITSTLTENGTPTQKNDSVEVVSNNIEMAIKQAKEKNEYTEMYNVFYYVVNGSFRNFEYYPVFNNDSNKKISINPATSYSTVTTVTANSDCTLDIYSWSYDVREKISLKKGESYNIASGTSGITILIK